MLSWIKNMFSQNYDEDMDYYDDEIIAPPPIENKATTEVHEHEQSYVPATPIRAVQLAKEKKEVSLTELVTITMSGYAATGDIAKYIKDKRPQVVNMERLSDPEIQRAIDYLSGVSYAVNGTLEMFTPKIYVILPEYITLKKD